MKEGISYNKLIDINKKYIYIKGTSPIKLPPKAPNADRIVSNEGLTMIQSWENNKITKNKNYFDKNNNHIIHKDINGHKTIGYGHKLTDEDIRSNRFKNGLSEKGASDLLKQDLDIAKMRINNYITVKLTQTQFDALLSFVLNAGLVDNIPNLKKIIDLINQSEFIKAADEMKSMNSGLDGKKLRREAEKELFLNGVYTNNGE